MKKSIRTVPQKAVLFFLSALLIVSSLSWYSSNSKVSALTSADLSFSDNGVKFICDREQFHATCYVDYSQSSIGYGTKCTGSSQQPHAAGTHSITREQALAEMKSQISSTYAPKVRNQTVGITMNQNQFDALVSLAYNTGGGTTLIANSPLVRYLKGELTEAQARQQYSNYKITAGGEVNSGLINRRNAEADLFFTPVSPNPTPGPTGNDNFHVCFDGYDAVAGGITIRGWCFDKRDTSVTMGVHVYIGGPAGDANAEGNPFTIANGTRTDVDAAYHCGANHGYDSTIFTSKTGSQHVYLYAVNPNSGESGLIADFTANIPAPNNPEGNVDSIAGKTGMVHVSGWTFDRDNLAAPLSVHVYIGGPAGSSNAEAFGISANGTRTDVDNAHHCGTNHGFDADIPTSKSGIVDVYIYAINIHGGSNQLIGSGQAAVGADTEAPVVTEAFAMPYLGDDAYRVCVKAEDNVGVKKVMIGTWINGATPPADSNWKEAYLDSDGYYYVDILRSEQSQTGNSFYNNQFYVYDYAGHKTFGTANMDYSIVSNTGKNIPEGEYRIYSATDPAKALDVYGASVQDNANVDIYANTGDSKQTFRLTYVGNGFYTIFNTNANKPVDVFGDTYLDGTNVCISSYHEGANQQWMFRPDSDGLNYNIVERANGNLLTVESGGNVAVYKENGSEAQKWRLARVLNSTFASFTIVDPVVTPGYTPAPQVSVKVDGVDLTEGFDYTAGVTSYSNGSGVVTVTGIGSYCDSVNINFTYTERPLGDVTMDGFISIDDVTELQRYLAEFFVLSDEQMAVADVNKDGKINIRDVTQLQRIIAEYV